MSLIAIKNIDEQSVKRYGENFAVGEVKDIPSDTIIAYSLMEISLSMKRINNKLGDMLNMTHIEHIHTLTDRNFGKPQNIFVQNFPDPDPWIVRKYKQWKKNRDWKKKYKLRRNK